MPCRNPGGAQPESGVVIAAVLMVLAALSLMAAAGKGDTALQWVQVRNARDYADAVRLAETGIARALAAESFRLDSGQSGRYCRTQSRCVEWTVQHVETTLVPPGLERGPDPQRALHFEASVEGRAGNHAFAPVVLGFLLITPGSPHEPPGSAVSVCRNENACPQGSAGPPIRRYWREAPE